MYDFLIQHKTFMMCFKYLILKKLPNLSSCYPHLIIYQDNRISKPSKHHKMISAYGNSQNAYFIYILYVSCHTFMPPCISNWPNSSEKLPQQILQLS